MPTAISVSNEERPSVLARTNGVDLETRLVRAVLARESVVAITGAAGSGKTTLLNRTIPVLSRSEVRVVQIGSPEKEPLDVRQMLDQLIDTAPDSGDDPARRFVAALTRPRANERQLALFIDDAQTLTNETFDCLGLVASAASVGPLPLQIVLAGRPDMWNRIRAHPALTANGIATQLVCRPEAGCVGQESAGQERADQERADQERAGPRPFGDLFEPGPWDPPSEPPPRPGRGIAAPVVPGAGQFKPVPPRAIPIRKNVLGRRERSRGRLAWAAAAVGLLAAIQGVTFWDRLPMDEIKGLLGFAAAPRTPAGLGSPARTQPTFAPEDRGPVEAATPLPAAPPETPTIVPPAAAAALATAPAPDTAPAAAVLRQEPSVVSAPAAPPVPPPNVPAAGPAPSAPAPPVQPSAAAEASAPAPEPAPVENRPQTPSAPATSTPAASTTATASPGLVEALLARGDALLETGDIVAARLLYERAAASSSGRGALAAGMTYDPRFLAQIGSRGIAADPRAAAAWYRRASTLGEPQAALLLTRLGVQGND